MVAPSGPCGDVGERGIVFHKTMVRNYQSNRRTWRAAISAGTGKKPVRELADAPRRQASVACSIFILDVPTRQGPWIIYVDCIALNLFVNQLDTETRPITGPDGPLSDIEHGGDDLFECWEPL